MAFTQDHFDIVLNSNDPQVNPYDLVKSQVRTHETNCEGCFTKKTHETNCDREIVTEHFEGKTGHFLCIGALDGKDQTLPLLQSGWRGVYVEPDPRTIVDLMHTVKPFQDRVEVISAAISSKAGLSPFYLAAMPGHSSLVDDWAERHADVNEATVNVNCITLEQLLSKYTEGFDYIQTDTEGMDHAIISSVDWSAIPRCELICTEAGPSVLKQLCQQGGYMITDLTQTNAYYQHRDNLL